MNWVKVDDDVPSHAVITGADLYIENLNKSYNGTYRCMASNSVGESFDDYILYVYGTHQPNTDTSGLGLSTRMSLSIGFISSLRLVSFIQNHVNLRRKRYQNPYIELDFIKKNTSQVFNVFELSIITISTVKYNSITNCNE